jgi:peroxiredoxin
MPALPPAPIPGHPAPDFALPDLADNELRLADFEGQVVLVNFWATW